MMKRSTPLARRAPITRRRQLPKVNPERVAKRRARYAAYLRTKVWREKRAACIERAGGQCEQVVPKLDRELGKVVWMRCPVTGKLHVHHKTYARFGGDELPEDLLALCKPHHELTEAIQFSYRSRRSA